MGCLFEQYDSRGAGQPAEHGMVRLTIAVEGRIYDLS